MFGQQYESNNGRFQLNITITCSGEKKFRVWAEEFQKRNSKYGDREIVVNGTRTIYFPFPVSPKVLFIGVLNSASPTDKDFKVEVNESPLVDYHIWLDSQTQSFLNLAIPFCQVAGFVGASTKGKLFKSKDDQFKILYFDAIRDEKGNVMNTPARIGHESGRIEVAKVKFDAYTIPMRLIIFLHEYSHKYKNPKIGLEISDEVGADINALYIYLGLGFSKIDAICVFANVFLKAQTKGNIERMRKIMDYIQRFENQEFAKKN
jgi:hypothetical protein